MFCCVVLLCCCVVVLSAAWCCAALLCVGVCLLCVLFALFGVDVVLLLYCV